MRENPCKPDCPKRSATCHGTCKDYKEWRAELDERNAQERLKRDLGFSSGQWYQTPAGYWRNTKPTRRK